MELTADNGRGYVPCDRNKQIMELPIGTIAIDSIYTPVLKVNYTVENTRVGQQTDFDKLILDVETDGTIPQTKPFRLLQRFSMSILTFC